MHANRLWRRVRKLMLLYNTAFVASDDQSQERSSWEITKIYVRVCDCDSVWLSCPGWTTAIFDGVSDGCLCGSRIKWWYYSIVFEFWGNLCIVLGLLWVLNSGKYFVLFTILVVDYFLHLIPILLSCGCYIMSMLQLIVPMGCLGGDTPFVVYFLPILSLMWSVYHAQASQPERVLQWA